MKKIPLKIIVTLVLLVALEACSHYEQIQKDLVESTAGDDESHNSGENCGSCHNQNGNEAVREAGWWTVSGTVYNDNNKVEKNAVIELWEKPNKGGRLIKRLYSDDKGNFYTNQIIDFNGGCYPSITVGSSYITMEPAYSGGSCNSCHGGVLSCKWGTSARFK